MAADWIKVESVTPDKPELSRMAQLLGIDQDAVFGKLFRVWSWADQNIVPPAHGDGTDESNDASVTVDVTESFIDRLTFCPGFAKAMAAVNWMQFTDGGIQLTNFTRHNGETAKKRALTARRVAKSKAKAKAEGNASVTHSALPEALPREEKRREENIRAFARSPGASAQKLEVIDGNGKPSASIIATLTPEQSAVVVLSCKALRKMGAIRFNPGDEGLAALATEGFTAEQIARTAGEKALRDADLWNDPDVHPELPDLLINGASTEEMRLTPAQNTALRGAVSQVSIGYIASTLRGRRRDAQAKPSPTRGNGRTTDKPKANDDFKGKIYEGTAIENLSPELRAAVDQALMGDSNAA